MNDPELFADNARFRAAILAELEAKKDRLLAVKERQRLLKQLLLEKFDKKGETMSESSNKQYNCVVSSELVSDLKYYYKYSSIEDLHDRILKESGFDIIFHVDLYGTIHQEIDFNFKPDGSILATFDDKVDFLLCDKNDKYKIDV